MEIIDSIVLHEEQSTKKIELSNGVIKEQGIVEEGISVSQNNNFRYKQLKYEENDRINFRLKPIYELFKEYSGISGLHLLYENKSMLRIIHNQDNCEKVNRIDYSELVVANTSSEKHGRIISYGITNQEISIDIVEFQVNLYVKYLQQNKEFEILRSGTYDVLMYPEVMGVLVHEIIGHLCEADNHLNSNKEYGIGYDFGFPITVYDDPNIENAWGSICVDDEGNKSEKVLLVERGKINNFMTSYSTASALQVKNNGHARCIKYNKKPIVRMTNTIMQPGMDNKNDMLAGMHDGIIARVTKGGYMYKDFFGITIVEGSYISGGKEQSISNCLIRGRISDIINHIIHISSETEMMSGRGCIKLGQGLLPVSVTAPYVIFKSLYVEQR